MNNQTIEEINKKELEKCYIVLHILKSKIRIGSCIKNLYLIYGTNMEGKRYYLTSTIDAIEKRTSEWYDIFQSLKRRKIEQIIYAIIPSENGIKESLKLAFKDIEIIDSMEDEINKLKRYIPVKSYESLKKTIRELVISEDEESFEINYLEFEEKYLINEFVKDMLSEKLLKLKEYCNIDKSIRELLYGFHYGSAYYSYVKPKKTEVYENLQDYLNKKMIYLEDNEKYSSFSKKDWAFVVNNIYLAKKELLKTYL